MKVGIVGVGYVGTALKEGFKEYHQVETYDLDTNLSSCNSIDELVEKTEDAIESMKELTEEKNEDH